MPDDTLDPIEAVKTIQTLAKVATESEPEGGETAQSKAARLETHLRMILAVCEKALPRTSSLSRRAKSPPTTG